MAQVRAPLSLPAKSAFFRPSAIGRMVRSTVFVSTSIRPSSRNRARPAQWPSIYLIASTRLDRVGSSARVVINLVFKPSMIGFVSACRTARRLGGTAPPDPRLDRINLAQAGDDVALFISAPRRKPPGIAHAYDPKKAKAPQGRAPRILGVTAAEHSLADWSWPAGSPWWPEPLWLRLYPTHSGTSARSAGRPLSSGARRDPGSPGWRQRWRCPVPLRPRSLRSSCQERSGEGGLLRAPSRLATSLLLSFSARSPTRAPLTGRPRPSRRSQGIHRLRSRRLPQRRRD